MSPGRHRRVTDLLGLTGEPKPGGPWAAVIDMTVILITLTAITFLCRALGCPAVAALFLGGCAGAATTRLNLGSRILRGRRD
ncbi:hypothetical protein ABTZ03_43505 [Kitasatospora sp. NPDC096077]|uniref:hypothetical protein n=1 Tax=Kitasatospora sp. NPDC096077 TaxID=3155544 RepID=UPI00332546E3